MRSIYDEHFKGGVLLRFFQSPSFIRIIKRYKPDLGQMRGVLLRFFGSHGKMHIMKGFRGKLREYNGVLLRFLGKRLNTGNVDYKRVTGGQKK
jgi:hypothetical protein